MNELSGGSVQIKASLCVAGANRGQTESVDPLIQCFTTNSYKQNKCENCWNSYFDGISDSRTKVSNNLELEVIKL